VEQLPGLEGSQILVMKRIKSRVALAIDIVLAGVVCWFATNCANYMASGEPSFGYEVLAKPGSELFTLSG
jgi:hypothetical protein